MKLRTWLLVACMVVVPALAMFSHWVPADVRRAMRSRGRECVERLFAAVAPAAADPATASPPGEPASSEIPEPAAPEKSEPVARHDVALVAAPRTALGGVAVDCRPVGDGSVHVASCRVAIDSTGQLHRVFQAAGSTPDGAVAALEEAVAAWQRRLADRTPPRPGGL